MTGFEGQQRGGKWGGSMEARPDEDTHTNHCPAPARASVRKAGTATRRPTHTRNTKTHTLSLPHCPSPAPPPSSARYAPLVPLYPTGLHLRQRTPHQAAERPSRRTVKGCRPQLRAVGTHDALHRHHHRRRAGAEDLRARAGFRSRRREAALIPRVRSAWITLCAGRDRAALTRSSIGESLDYEGRLVDKNSSFP